jgi:predicted Zn finger-like uncharacterized protein
MLTRCPECSTSFRVTAEQLRLAQGAVRCGNCEAVFDALTTLSEDQPDNAVGQGERSALDSTEDSPADAEPGDASTIGSVDYDQLSGQLSGYFGETNEPKEPEDAEEPAEPGPAAAEETAPSVPKFQSGSKFSESEQRTQISTKSESADETDDDTSTAGEDEWLRQIFDEADDNTPVFIVEGETPTTSQPDYDFGNGVEADDRPGTGRGNAPEPEDFAEYSQDSVPQTDTDGDGERTDPGIPGWQDLSPTADTKDKLRNGATANNRWWAIGSVILLITLILQLVHDNRDALATHARYGETIRTLYSLLRLPLYPEWDLRAYEIRGSEAVSGESSAGVLDIRAQMVINGTDAVGEPLLRIVLRDRWANLVARGVFSASEYRSDQTSVGAMLRPGNLLPISVTVEDPGDAAQGYELDLCVMTRYAGLKCDRKAER